MTFKELISDPLFDLPLKQPEGVYFDKYIEELLSSYLKKVDELDDTDITIEGEVVSDKHLIKNVQTKIINGLINSVKAYLDGYPYKAYDIFNKVFNEEVKSLYKIIKQVIYPETQNFYRLRYNTTNYVYSRSEMFHIPFSERGKVATQRFSIPGFPSLYLGRTLYVCWEEMNRPDLNNFQAVRLEAKKQIQLLDLSPPEVLNNDLTSENYYYIMTWPLIACCSVKVKNHSDTFKPEYIIPQLLLQWIRSNDKLDGIRYKSNHIDSELYKQKGELYNIVLPVKEILSSGHCQKLKETFNMTEVISWQLQQYAIGGQIFLSLNDSPLDKKLPHLELIKGAKYPYSYSALGKLEGYLDGLKANEID